MAKSIIEQDLQLAVAERQHSKETVEFSCGFPNDSQSLARNDSRSVSKAMISGNDNHVLIGQELEMDSKSTQSMFSTGSNQTMNNLSGNQRTHDNLSINKPFNPNGMIVYPHIPGQESCKMVLVPLVAILTEGAGLFGEPVRNYCADIGIGSPQQKFKIQFELNLDNNFLPHYCWRPWRSSLHYKQGFRATKSQTSSKGQDYYSMYYDNCEFLGKLHEDNVKFKSQTRVKTENGEIKYRRTSMGLRMSFLAVDIAQRNNFGRLPVDGLLGLGPKLKSELIGCRNLLIKMQEDSLIDKLYVSIWFDEKHRSGQLLFGGHDPSRYKGPIYWHKSQTDTWTLNLSGMTIGTSVIEQALPCVAHLSSVINHIRAPISAMERIYSYFKVHRDPKSGLVWVHSDNYAQLPDIHIHTDLVDITLEPTQYLGKAANDRCYLQIVPSSSDRLWILGTIFLENVYSIYDLNNHKIGLARKATTPIENFKSNQAATHLCASHSLPLFNTNVNGKSTSQNNMSDVRDNFSR